MQVVNDGKGMRKLENGNDFKGEYPVLENSSIVFNGENNIFVCEKGVRIVDSTIEFNGNNSIVYLSESKYDIKLNVSINHNSVFYIGKNNYINKNIHVIISEEKHVFIGSNGLYSLDNMDKECRPTFSIRLCI